MRPVVRALAIISRSGQKPGCFGQGATQYLVQCDEHEAFYRLPGGAIEAGETAAATIARELMEEFDLEVTVGSLAAVDETFFEADGTRFHEVNLLHRATAAAADDLPDVLPHNEHRGVKAVWRTLPELAGRPLYPTGILEYLQQERTDIIHLVTK